MIGQISDAIRDLPPEGESVDTSCKPPPPLPPLPPPRESPSPRGRPMWWSNAPSLPPWELEKTHKKILQHSIHIQIIIFPLLASFLHMYC